MCMHDRVPMDMTFSELLRGQQPPLPNDVMERIFALLPIQAKLVCRCVCKSWNSILSTDSLLTHTSNTHPRSRKSGFSNVCFMLTTRGPFASTLDPLTNIWHKLSKPSCPGASVLAASHGLVCVGNQVSECRSLAIFNLLANTWRFLPNTLHVGLLHKVTMAMDPLSHAYVVVVTGEDTSAFRGRRRYRLRTEVYDSVSACWRMAGDAIPEAKFGSDPGVWHDGLFYCITEMPYGTTAFNVGEGRWMDVSVKMPIGISHPSLMSCKGQLMMVGIQEGDADHAQCVCDANSDLSVLGVTEQLSNMPWIISRSLSWSAPPHMWAALQFILSAWPSISLPLRTHAAAAVPVLSSLMSPSLLLLLSSLTSPSSSLPRSPSTPPSPLPPPDGKKFIRVWSLTNRKQWMMIDEMPNELCIEFMKHLTSKTPLICAGVGDEICISSHQSPNTVILNVTNMGWRYAASDPSFPRSRDTHLLGFAVQPDSACVP